MFELACILRFGLVLLSTYIRSTRSVSRYLQLICYVWKRKSWFEISTLRLNHHSMVFLWRCYALSILCRLNQLPSSKWLPLILSLYRFTESLSQKKNSNGTPQDDLLHSFTILIGKQRLLAWMAQTNTRQSSAGNMSLKLWKVLSATDDRLLRTIWKHKWIKWQIIMSSA